MIDVNQSVFVECDNCGADGEPTTDRTDGGDPILECPSCMARWATDEPRLVALLIKKSSAARGVDRWAVEHAGYSASEWSDVTGRDRSSVSRNVRRALQ